MSEMLTVKQLYKSFELGTKEVEVLRGISLEIHRGHMVSLVGASGAGKSTLLHIMGALDHPTRGEVYFEGKSIFQRSEAELAYFRNQKIGFVFQFHHLLPEFTALENVMIPVLISGGNKTDARINAEKKLYEMDLSHRLHHKPGELSGGEQQRVAIARALILQPPLLLADELTGNLDTETGEKIMDLLLELNEQYKMTMIIATHNEAIAERLPHQIRIVDGLLQQK